MIRFPRALPEEARGSGGYIASATTGLAWSRLGFSVNPDRRLKQLQTANASTLRLIAAIYSTADFEALLHWSNKSRRLHGEWFDDADGSISSVLALAAQREDDEICIVGEA